MTAGMVGRVGAMAANTFKEAVRNRAFIGLMLGALILILASLVLSELVVFDQRKRIVQNFGLFFVSFAGVIIAVIMGVVLVYKELERKTIYSILPKPVQRFEFILGRYAGMFVLLVVVAVVMSLAWFVVIGIRGLPFRVEYVKAVLLILGELSIVSAVAILFSSFSSPVLSGIFTFGIFVLGREVHIVEQMLVANKGLFVSVPSLRPLGQTVTAVFPDLSMFDISKEILLEADVSWLYVVQAYGYAACYVIGLVTLSALIFQRRDFV